MQTSDAPYLSIIVPVFNEGIKVVEGLKRLEAAALSRYPSELIFVDDGSDPDRTPPYEEILAGKTNIRVLRNERNRGKGYSVKRGIFTARGEFVFYTDADVAYDLSLLPRYIEALEAGADLAIGNRVHPESYFSLHPRHFPYIYQRQVMGATFNILVNRILKIRIKDTQCGFKCMKRRAARVLFRDVSLEGFSFEVEMLFLARKHGFAIEQLPVRLLYQGHPSSVRMIKDSFGMFLAVLRIWKRDRDGLYHV